MLDYDWGNPSTMMFTGDETSQEEADQNRHLFDPYATAHTAFNEATATAFLNHNPNAAAQFATTRHNSQNQLLHQPPQSSNHHHYTHLNSLYDPCAAYATSSYDPNHNQTSMLEPGGPNGGYVVIPKTEPSVGGLDYTSSGRIGLNLGVRTYFSSSEDDFVSRLYHRSRISGQGTLNSPRCQAEGCNADLTNAKHYHRRHKVCEFHSKAATVIAAGLTQRFCQQCSRFHLLSEFDNGKRSCRKRLADHNRRRRKSQQQVNQEPCNKSPISSPQNFERSPPDSGAHSSSVTIAISPPRISLDYFGQRSYGETSNSSASTSSLFFSNG